MTRILKVLENMANQIALNKSLSYFEASAVVIRIAEEKSLDFKAIYLEGIEINKIDNL